MTRIQFDLDDEIARKIKGFFDSGRAGRLVFEFESRQIIAVECTDVWRPSPPASRRYVPTASGVYVVSA